MICPAYHSCFILSEEDQHKFFNMFGEDSIPKDAHIAPSEKDKNGISKGTTKKSWKKRHYYVPMIVIKPAGADSTAIDSSSAIQVGGKGSKKSIEKEMKE